MTPYLLSILILLYPLAYPNSRLPPFDECCLLLAIQLLVPCAHIRCESIIHPSQIKVDEVAAANRTELQVPQQGICRQTCDARLPSLSLALLLKYIMSPLSAHTHSKGTLLSPLASFSCLSMHQTQSQLSPSTHP